MLANLNGWHAIIILAVILLLFGAPKIPALARSVGQSLRIFKTEVGPELKGRSAEDTVAESPVAADASAAARG